MAKSYTITAKYDATDGSLKIEPARRADLTLAPDTSPIHSVRWGFEGIDGLVAAGWAPSIRFVLGPKKKVPPYSGPFINLTRTTSAVIASGNTGKGGTYRYFAVLKPPVDSELSEIRSTEARLFNQVTELTPAVIKVWQPRGKKGLLRVEPEAVTCTPGQSILWEVIEETANIGEWYPRLVFVDGPDGTNSHLGPFTSLDTRDKGILASGSTGRHGRYNYVFQMISVEDERVRFKSSTDPTVDDMGDPPDEGDP